MSDGSAVEASAAPHRGSGAGPPEGERQRWLARHPVTRMVLGRGVFGILTMLCVSVIVFAATEILPGNAAYAVLGHSAAPERIKLLEAQLHLNQSIPSAYWEWLTGLVRGHLGTSLVNTQGVWQIVEPRAINSLVLVCVAGVIGTILGVLLGGFAAMRKNSVGDHILSSTLLAIYSLPEFVVAIVVVLVLATSVFHLFPAVSFLPPGAYIWQYPSYLVLPVITLVLVITPYIFRMMRAATIDALASEYAEMARLKGMRRRRVLIAHAAPNAMAPTIQVIGVIFLYLAGGIVLVEYVFAYPGIGQGLVNAVNDRDVPVLQFIVVLLAAVYVVVNITTDVLSLMVTPRRRFPR